MNSQIAHDQTRGSRTRNSAELNVGVKAALERLTSECAKADRVFGSGKAESRAFLEARGVNRAPPGLNADYVPTYAVSASLVAALEPVIVTLKGATASELGPKMIELRGSLDKLQTDAGELLEYGKFAFRKASTETTGTPPYTVSKVKEGVNEKADFGAIHAALVSLSAAASLYDDSIFSDSVKFIALAISIKDRITELEISSNNWAAKPGVSAQKGCRAF
jgi:hypothetical protein